MHSITIPVSTGGEFHDEQGDRKGDLWVDGAGGKRLVDLDFVDDIRLMPENNK